MSAVSYPYTPTPECTLDAETQWKKIIDCTEEELIALRFLGPDALEGIKKMIEDIRAAPDKLGRITCFQIDLLRRRYEPQA